MRRNIYLAIIGLVIFSFGCSHEVEKATVENYIPPSLKAQPKLFYPVDAQANSIYGITKASIKISKTGSVDRVFIFKSAGSKVLDEAVSDYCKKLLFNPALKDGEPIESRIIWEVNFRFANEAFSANEYLRDIDELYDLANHAVAQERMSLLKDAVKKHLEYINKNSDALNFNLVISKLINNSLVKEWKDDWNTYPLSFLVYYDFIKRFSDYDSISYVKEVMLNAINNDLHYIQNYSVSSMEQKEGKEKLIRKIKQFISDNYPGRSVVNYKKNFRDC